MCHSLTSNPSSDRLSLGFTAFHSCVEQSQPLPRKRKLGMSRRSWTRRVLVGSFPLASLFFVKPAAVETRGNERNVAAIFTDSARTKLSESDPQLWSPPAITSLILAVGLITLLRRR